jgi:hypothetical protein
MLAEKTVELRGIEPLVSWLRTTNAGLAKDSVNEIKWR